MDLKETELREETEEVMIMWGAVMTFFVFLPSLAGVHGPAGLPVARPGQRGDQRDEGAARTQREHAEEHPA